MRPVPRAGALGRFFLSVPPTFSGRGPRPVEQPITAGDYVVIKALEDGVSIIGLTHGKDTRFHHSEKLDRGEVMVAQFTEHTAAIKVRGRARILTRVGVIDAGPDDTHRKPQP